MSDKKNMVEALNTAMDEEMERDEDVLVMGEDVGENGGVFRVTEGLHDTYGPERVIDTPLAESGIVSTALGMAVYGMKPIAEIQFMGFTYPAFDQIISHVSRIRNRSRGDYNAQMVIRAPYGGGIHAPEHHSESTEALYAHTPGIKVVIPSTPTDAYGLLKAAIRDPDPVCFWEPKKIYRSSKEKLPDGDHTTPIGEAAVREEGEDVTVISWGAMMEPTLEAAEQTDIDVEVIDLRTISPMDFDTVQESVEKTGRAVIVHEAPKTNGVGAEISARITENDILHLKAPVKRVTGFDTIFPQYQLEEKYLPDSFRVQRAIRTVYDF
ncbi:MAG: alpha-ketoacid dehydrogenase subunit beta [Candidatus Nanohaloarchaeota archaeon QJJ-5]|nr:alpha-ketoacid dehydrogenase subunit beta [Candidatus Nanohaloarchaeota archaeon QJJ-5]